MSLGDHLRFLRAFHGGESTLEIAKAIGIQSPWPINEIEQRYREVGSDDLVAKLAEYYHVPLDELLWHRQRSRKTLSEFLGETRERNQQVQLVLRHGETLRGKVQWYDLGAIALQSAEAGGLLIVQRHTIVDWRPG